MSIPKIIWAVWCDFNKKSDGVLTDDLTYFKERIIQQHPKWKVNIITSYSVLTEYIKENNILLQIIDNNYIFAAHKSDAIRFFLLNKFGGFWLDLSTFLFVSLDIYYIKQPSATFIGCYTPPFIIEEFMFGSLNEMYDSVKYNKVLQKFVPFQEKFIKLNDEYKKFPFIPENFFIASVPGHPITNNVLTQLLSFWESALPNIVSDETRCYEVNKLMNNLAGKIFIINDLNYSLSTTFSDDDYSIKKFKENVINNIWHCGYVFNYLQMYIAMVNYIKMNHCEITQEENTNKIETIYNQELCTDNQNTNTCNNLVIKNPDGSTIYLFSLTYNRIIKWSNSVDERISFDNTYITNLIKRTDPNNFKQQITREIINKGIYQIKFGSWTRDSKIINLLKQKFPIIKGGNKYKITRKHNKQQKSKNGKKVNNYRLSKKYFYII